MNRQDQKPRQNSFRGTATTIYTCYDKIYTVPGIGRAPSGLPGPRAPPAWYQALPEQAQKACLLGALSYRRSFSLVTAFSYAVNARLNGRMS